MDEISIWFGERTPSTATACTVGLVLSVALIASDHFPLCLLFSQHKFHCHDYSLNFLQQSSSRAFVFHHKCLTCCLIHEQVAVKISTG